MTLTLDTGFDFTVPDGLNATGPAEARGLARDGVRMLVGTRARGDAEPVLSHHTVADLPGVLRPGDLVVVNNSATLPAALRGVLPDGVPVLVHVSSARPDARGTHLIELRRPAGDTSAPYGLGPTQDSAASASPARIGLVIALPGGARAELTAPFTERLWFARLVTPRMAPAKAVARRGGDGDTAWYGDGVPAYLMRYGTPIRYSYLTRDWPLSDYQTVFATEPGSSEMPSAGRPFTADLVVRLVSRGVHLAPITLHTGVASPEAHETPYAEWYRVPEATARLVEHTRAHGGRVIAVGTTVVRALESAVGADGRIRAAEGWTELIIRPSVGAGATGARRDGEVGTTGRPGGTRAGVRVVDGLLTGWHEPRASHLMMLEAIAGRRLLDACYAQALSAGYLWHEFGDVNLLMSD
jgi:S-adenosylmethionine:tRNA ribosyltransferase-isomerase